MATRTPKYQMTMTQWAAWANKREADADKVAAQYVRQAEAIRSMLVNNACECDPIIVLGATPDGPSARSALVTHSLYCRKEG